MIYAARGETQSFQVAVHASGGKLTGLNFSVSNLYGIQQDDHGRWRFTGRLISQILYREKYMTVLAHSPTWNGPPNLPITNIDTFPDALIPFIDPATGKPPAGGTYSAAPLNVAAVHNAVFWVHVVIPRDAKAGDYLGIYTVTRDEGLSVGLIHVHVWNFTLRREPYLKSSFEGSGVYSPGLREALLRNDLMPDTVKLQDESRFINRYGLNAADRPWLLEQRFLCCM